MRILFIDDVREPTPGFRKTFEISKHAEVLTAKSSQEALYILMHDKNFDEIWFDYDLGIINDVKDTTMPIAHYLGELSYEDNLGPLEGVSCIIHTPDPVGREILAAALKRWNFTVLHLVD